MMVTVRLEPPPISIPIAVVVTIRSPVEDPFPSAIFPAAYAVIVVLGGIVGDVHVAVHMTTFAAGYIWAGLCSQYWRPAFVCIVEPAEGLVRFPAILLALLSIVNWKPANTAMPFGLLLVIVNV